MTFAIGYSQDSRNAEGRSGGFIRCEPEDCPPPVKIEHSYVYREFLAERDEILRLKWIESEKAGRDIGFDAALLMWILRHQGDWRAARGRAIRAGMCPF